MKETNQRRVLWVVSLFALRRARLPGRLERAHKQWMAAARTKHLPLAAHEQVVAYLE